MSAHSLKLNAKKHRSFGSNSEEGNILTVTKNLGFLMDDNLRFRSHVNKIIQKRYLSLKNCIEANHL